MNNAASLVQFENDTGVESQLIEMASVKKIQTGSMLLLHISLYSQNPQV